MFENEYLESIVKKVSKHYHKKVQCIGILPKKTYFGIFSRCDSLNSILQFLQKQTHVQFSIKGDTILAQP
ncbi:DUF4974 domain-containing protein [Niastella vici]|uniref:DUF4974 domain-containing protein n=1 Tax=Niastella vici TaxID=1703345 RepID=UPI0009BF555A